MMNSYSRRTFISNYRSQPEIIKAIVKNNLPTVKKLFKNDINECITSDQNSRTPLHLAAALGRTQIVELLIKSECYSTVNYRDNDLLTPLHRACSGNHESTVQILIQFNAEVNARSRLHLTPLHVCAAFNSLECARLIINSVSNINATDSFGATALHYAVYNNNFTMIEFLLTHGAESNVQDKHGQRPIHYAAIADSPLTIRMLVEKGGSNVNVRNKDLMTPLHFAIAFKSQNAFLELLSYDANLEAQDIFGNKPSHWAAFIGCESIFDEVNNRTDVISTNLNGVTPLHFSCGVPTCFSVAMKIMDKAGDLNITDKFGRTPMHFAAMNMREIFITELINRGANCDICDNNLETPLHKATLNCHNNVIEILTRSGAQIDIANKDGFTPLHLSVMASLPLNCKLLIDAGANPLLWDSSGRTPHFIAVFKGSFDCFYHLMSSERYSRLLEDKKEDSEIVFFPLLDAFKRSLLHYAAASTVCPHEFIEILLCRRTLKDDIGPLDPKIEALLEATFRQFDINQQDIYGRTPLHYVCRRPLDIESDVTFLVTFLINAGAKFDILDQDNRLPFHYAIVNGYTSTLYLLIDLKWLENREDYFRHFSGCCPLKLAAFYGQCLAITELINYGFNDFDSAIELAVQRFHWNCVIKLLSHIRKRSVIRKLAMITAGNGSMNGLKTFLNLNILDIDSSDNKGRTLLMMAALSNEGTSCIELLLDKRASLQAKDCHGRNALFYAVLGGNFESIKLLLHSGIRFVKDTHAKTVFHLIAGKGDLQMLDYFYNLSKECRFYVRMCTLLLAKDVEGFSPLEFACLKGHHQILVYYVTKINKAQEQKLMYFAGITGNINFVEFLLKKNGSQFLNLVGPYERSLLHYCCMSRKKNLSLLKLLLELKFDTNSVDKKGLTPLLSAASVGNSTIVDYLLKNTDSNIKALDIDENTILHLACQSGKSSCALLLLKHIANQDLIGHFIVAENNQKQTCLHLSAQTSLSSVIHELLRLGASATAEDAMAYPPSLYCSRDADAAYCLLIIETFIQQEHEYALIMGQQQDETSISESDNRRSSIQSMLNDVDKRKSIRQSCDSFIESRLSRLSAQIFAQCDAFSRISSKNSLKDNNRLSATGEQQQIVNNKTVTISQNDTNLVDSDSELY